MTTEPRILLDRVHRDAATAVVFVALGVVHAVLTLTALAFSLL